MDETIGRSVVEPAHAHASTPCIRHPPTKLGGPLLDLLPLRHDPGDALATDRLAVRELGQSQKLSSVMAPVRPRPTPGLQRSASSKIFFFWSTVIWYSRRFFLARCPSFRCRAAFMCCRRARLESLTLLLPLLPLLTLASSFSTSDAMPLPWDRGKRFTLSTGRLIDCMPDVNQGGTADTTGSTRRLCPRAFWRACSSSSASPSRPAFHRPATPGTKMQKPHQ